MISVLLILASLAFGIYGFVQLFMKGKKKRAFIKMGISLVLFIAFVISIPTPENNEVASNDEEKVQEEEINQVEEETEENETEPKNDESEKEVQEDKEEEKTESAEVEQEEEKIDISQWKEEVKKIAADDELTATGKKDAVTWIVVDITDQLTREHITNYFNDIVNDFMDGSYINMDNEEKVLSNIYKSYAVSRYYSANDLPHNPIYNASWDIHENVKDVYMGIVEANSEKVLFNEEQIYESLAEIQEELDKIR